MGRPPHSSSQRAKAPGSGSRSRSRMSLLRAGLRVALVALTAVAAMVLPNLEQMMSLLGAVTGSLLAVIFPVIIDIRCRLRHDWPKVGTAGRKHAGRTGSGILQDSCPRRGPGHSRGRCHQRTRGGCVCGSSGRILKWLVIAQATATTASQPHTSRVRRRPGRL